MNIEKVLQQVERDIVLLWESIWTPLPESLKQHIQDLRKSERLMAALWNEGIEPWHGRQLTTAAADYGLKRRWLGLEPDWLLRRRLLAVITDVKVKR